MGECVWVLGVWTGLQGGVCVWGVWGVWGGKCVGECVWVCVWFVMLKEGMLLFYQ